jgi:hypothetical protein
MCEDMTNIDLATVEMKGCNQPILVAANVKNDPMIEFIGGGKDPSQFSKAVEFGLLYNLKPTQQRCLAVGMFLRKLDQGSASNDVHKRDYISI